MFQSKRRDRVFINELYGRLFILINGGVIAPPFII
jgi:hypothetical protein